MKTDPPPPKSADEDEPTGTHLSIFERDPEAVAEIAIKAFARAVDAAIRENGRLGIASYGAVDGKIVVHQPPKPR